MDLTKNAEEALDSLLQRAECYLRGQAVLRENNRDVYVLENDLRFKLFLQGKRRDNLLLLEKLENLIDSSQTVFPALPKNYLD